MVDLEILKVRLHDQLVAQHLAEGSNVPLAVAEREEHLADRVLGLHPEGAIERTIRLRDAKLGVEHEQRLPDRVDDVEQQPLGGGNVAVRPL